MMYHDTVQLLLLIVMILLPMIPAICIYRSTPTTTVDVSGPLAGLTVKASGAFAAYVVVLAACCVVTQSYRASLQESANDERASRSLWTVKGTITADEQDDNELMDNIKFDIGTFYNLDADTFTLALTQHGIGLWPIVHIIHKFGFENVRLPDLNGNIDKNLYDVDRPGHIIKIRQAIKLRRRTQVISKVTF